MDTQKREKEENREGEEEGGGAAVGLDGGAGRDEVGSAVALGREARWWRCVLLLPLLASVLCFISCFSGFLCFSVFCLMDLDGEDEMKLVVMVRKGRRWWLASEEWWCGEKEEGGVSV